MKIIQPQQIGYETGLLSTNVSETEYGVYDEYTTYAVGDKVVVLNAYHRVYEALASVTGVFPPDISYNDQIVWLDLGPTNRYGMFDGQAGTETRRSDIIDVTIQPPSPVDTVAFFGLVADSITVTVLSSADVVLFQRTTTLTLPSANPLESPQRVGDTIVSGLPGEVGMKVRAEITIASGDAVCGLMLPGISKSLGITQAGSSVGIIDYSIKEVDQFGRPFIVKRRFSKRGNFRLVIPNNLVDSVHKTLSSYRAEAVAWVGTEDLQSTIIYGWYRDFDIVIAGPTVSTCNLVVEGLI